VIEQHDDKTIRCPRIGGHVNFKLCRSENNLLPCRWVVGCWHMYIDVNTFLHEHYSKKQLGKIFLPPKPKIESLVEMAEQAKKRKCL
jgi:hypothetical protein